MYSHINSLSRVLPTTYSLENDPDFVYIGKPRPDGVVRREILLYQAQQLVKYGVTDKVSEAKNLILANQFYKKSMNKVMQAFRRDQKKRRSILNGFGINKQISDYNGWYMENARNQFVEKWSPWVWEYCVCEDFDLPPVPMK